MKSSVFSKTMLIGHTELKTGDISMGGVFAEFIPNDNYFRYIQKYVWDFWATRTPDYKIWESLRFTVQLENGFYLHPVGGFTFDNIREMPNEPIRIDIAGLPQQIIEDFIISDPSRPFVENPWVTISIEQKIAFEDELQKEINKKAGLLSSLFKSDSDHLLANFNCSALCKNDSNDDVLFSIYDNKGSDKNFALVHLTWTEKKENNQKLPTTILYDSFDSFKYEKMYPDKTEWEY
jgi:hypothetical protein